MFKSMTCDDLYHTLYSIIDNDYTLDDFSMTQKTEEFLFMLELYDLVFVTSNERVLLTKKGERVLQYLNTLLI